MLARQFGVAGPIENLLLMLKIVANVVVLFSAASDLCL